MVIDGSSAKVSKTNRRIHYGAKVRHAYAIRAGDEGMARPVASLGVPLPPAPRR